MNLNPVLLIPARMGSARLPDKPLALIGDKPMIVHVLERALEADIGPVFVATDDVRIASAVSDYGGQAVMTQNHHQSGSDRIYEALTRLDEEKKFNAIINVQGDLPTIAPQAIRAALAPLRDRQVDIATLCTPITDRREAENPNIVKLVGSKLGSSRLRALYFTRAPAPYGDGPLYHHIGLYAYRRQALAHFVALPPSPLEQSERLEQLRALEAGMRIDSEIVDDVPLGVDTLEDLMRARQILAKGEIKGDQNQ